jgi:hypothetical protein
MKKKIYLFYINNDDIFLENDIESEEEIQNFKVVKGKIIIFFILLVQKSNQ